MASAPTPVVCFDKERLLREFAAAVSDYHRVQSAQVAAVKKGEDFPFELELAKAAQRRENAKYAIIAHQEQHGC